MARRMISRRRLLAGGAATVAAAACSRETPGASPSDSRHTAAPGRRVREVAERVDGQPTVEGAGVRLHRMLGSRALSMLDPFLLLDQIHSDNREDYIRGFPSHPHRGFETVTYMLEGTMVHRDSLGNHGRLGPGSAQWMTAGHGIVHSEMPEDERGLLWGFQLWVNLPAKKKLTPPRYQDIAPAAVVELAIEDAHVRLVAGEAGGRRGPVEGIATDPLMLDVAVPRGGRFSHPVAFTHNAFALVFDGAIALGSARTLVRAGQLAVLGPGDTVTARADDGGRMLLLAGEPLGEPVARYGPFVMNTQAELEQAFEDYRSGRLTVL